MAHYSEMEFLFSNISINDVTVKINNTSKGANPSTNSEANVYNILKNPLNTNKSGYTIFKDDGVKGTSKIKNYYKDSIYSHQTNKNPYVELINNFGYSDIRQEGKPGAGLILSPSDFAYLKDLGVYPINRMIILRRFPEGCFVPENLDLMSHEPISKIIGWIKPEQNFGKIEFNETWGKTTERFDVMLADIIKNNAGGIDVKSIFPIPDFAQGVLFELYKKAGLLDQSGINDDSDYGSGNNQWGLNNIPIGDPNVLHEAPFRDPEGQNIQSDFSFELETTYEQKFIGEVDPGNAMMDILDNIYAMGTSNMVYYWGDDSISMKKAKNSAKAEGGGLNEWWSFVKSICEGFWKAMNDMMTEYIDKISKNSEELAKKGKELQGKKDEIDKKIKIEKDIADENQQKISELGKITTANKEKFESYRKLRDTAGAKITKLQSQKNTLTLDNNIDNTSELSSNTMKQAQSAISATLQTILTSTIGKHRFRIRGSIELMVGGVDSSAPWHIMIGNPYSPWLNTSHIVVTSCSVESNNEMGFNDMPTRLTAKFNCKFSRSLGKQELLRMSNNTYRRTYSNPSNMNKNITQPTEQKETIGKIQTSGVAINSNGSPINEISTGKTPGIDPSVSNYTYANNTEYTKSGKYASYNDRKEIAKEMGIKNYTGTAAQNTEMLENFRSRQESLSIKKIDPSKLTGVNVDKPNIT